MKSDDAKQPSNHRPKRTRWFTNLFIALYLGWLGHGVACHALQYRVGAHPAMYFTVWDMFCGWSGWSHRTHIVAEGESGEFYELTPTRWDEYHAFSDLGRQHYDPFFAFAGRIGTNCLKHTRHEPITQIHVVNETWSKKFNVPEALWTSLHDEPSQPLHYFHESALFSADGMMLTKASTFQDQQREVWLAASIRGQTPGRQLFAVGSGKGTP